ncbi:Transcriptional regulator, TetR family [Cystobacter fuscus DSM 2262]|uniref:Transcriptional regulator, TetR family n=1 Tax=Cystobacter fuscus (strain ATCC 25194 / DSM 2262 / NBRC 100088 / M29) TaxID=1242864 RepID=S9QPV3_CYSF2|nr:TetR/AcrR family transcriptional regulator [Cystobacter fuscus]EPX63349.1 Transcriptional regulator, TetR family [Cystobacter fuscus DSM 2262]
MEKAIDVFWSKGFAATSTDDLLNAMGIGRQSLYNAFGDKRQLYLEALRAYQRNTTSGHLARLTSPTSPLDGILDLLIGLVPEDDARRSLGCMGVGSVGEFGTTDPELIEMREKIAPVLHARLVQRIREGQAKGEIDGSLEPAEAASFIQMTMTGLQVAARGGAGADDLHGLARFTVDRLRAK